MEKIVASYIVKPSSPTPVALKIHKLASIDQIAAPVYIPLIFFYQNSQPKHHTEISRRLRESLSEILTVFYPLAGRVKENSFVDCNDGGAMLVEARVHRRIEQLIQQPEMEELRRLIAVDSLLPHNDDGFLVSVKANYFDCGGVVVGVCFSHKVGDVSSFVTFMNAWAATSRGDEVSTIRTIHPLFDLARHFPPGDLSSTTDAAVTTEKIVTKRIVFEREKLTELKKMTAASSDEVKDPSSVEALSVVIWRSFIKDQRAKSGAATTFVATHTVNLRPRTDPPIPDHTFGNCVSAVAAAVSVEEDGNGDGVHVSRLRAAIRAVDGDYINSVIKGGMDKVGDLFKAGNNCFFTSWWRFPMYEVDFGWGKPAWVCTATMPANNTTILMSTPSGDGIEAWVNAADEDFFRLLQANCNCLLPIN